MTSNTKQVQCGLITACSSTRTVAPLVRVQDMPLNLNMQEALDWWTDAAKTSLGDSATITPGEQYRGTGFNTLVRIQSLYPLETRIVTGGAGLIKLDEPIVPYDFTANKNEEHNIWQHVTKEPFVQTVWWKKINALRDKGENPVADFVRSIPGLTVISTSKVFLRYIAGDILSLSTEERKKVRILLPASSLGSVPAQLRPMIIPFSRHAVAHLPGNRNDTSHRAAEMFFEEAASNPEWLSLPIEEHAKLYDVKVEGRTANGGMTTE